MKNFALLLIFAVALSACNTSTEKAGKEAKEAKEEVPVLTVDQVLDSPDAYLDKEVIIKGMVMHVCKHGGQKLFVAGSEEGTALRINTSESIPEFSLDLEGSEGEFTGVFKLMTEEYKAEAIAEHKEHHGEEAEEEHVHEEEAHPDDTEMEKTYYLVASEFKTI